MNGTTISLILVFEDELQLHVMERILLEYPKKFNIEDKILGRGFGFIKRNINHYNTAAKDIPYFIIVDLDKDKCAPNKIELWLSQPKDPNLLFRIAIYDIESWILADFKSFKKYFSIKYDSEIKNFDKIKKPKKFLINCMRHSSKKFYIEDICPKKGSTARIGPNYNDRLRKYVFTRWNPNNAKLMSPSLERTVNRLNIFFNGF